MASRASALAVMTVIQSPAGPDPPQAARMIKREMAREAGMIPAPMHFRLCRRYEQPVVAPQDSHLRQVPLRTRVSDPHSGQGSPS